MKTKKRLIKEAIAAYPVNTDRQIADRVKCHPSYVHNVRKELTAARDEAAEITGELAWRMSQGKNKPKPEEKVEAANDVDAILDQRGSRYGSFVTHAEITQMFKNVVAHELTKKSKVLAADQQEALDMIFHKIGRIINGDPDYADSWIDIAGYAKLVADRLEGKER